MCPGQLQCNCLDICLRGAIDATHRNLTHKTLLAPCIRELAFSFSVSLQLFLEQLFS